MMIMPRPEYGVKPGGARDESAWEFFRNFDGQCIGDWNSAASSIACSALWDHLARDGRPNRKIANFDEQTDATAKSIA
jgi:hypothetical protein